MYDKLYMACWVPQGSILGSVLFLLWINDIYMQDRASGKVKLSDDDTNLFIFGKSCASINAETNLCVPALSQWFIVNKL